MLLWFSPDAAAAVGGDSFDAAVACSLLSIAITFLVVAAASTGVSFSFKSVAAFHVFVLVSIGSF